jgi:protein disulfide-isomerase
MASAAIGQPTAVRWQGNLEAARRIAAQSNRMVLIHFWAEWCGPCQAMEQTVFSRPEVATALERDYVPCRLNLDQFPSTANQYGVTRIPTDVIITPQGQVVTRFVGAADVARYLDRIGRVAAMRRGDPSPMVAQIPGGPPPESAGPAIDRPAEAGSGEFCRANAPLSSQPQVSPVNPPYAGQPNYAGLTPGNQGPAGPQPQVGPQLPAGSQPLGGPPHEVWLQSPGGAQTAASPQGIAGPQGANPPSPAARNPGTSFQGLAGTIVELPPGSPPLALDGFCPVQLTENDCWVLGNRRWGAIHEGRTYLFSGPEQQNRFLADPIRFAPVLGGDDAVKLVEEGKRVPGSRSYGCWFLGKVYLFASQETYRRFATNPFRYLSKLEAANSAADRPPLR